MVLQASEACSGFVRLADMRCRARLREPSNEDPPEIGNRCIRASTDINTAKSVGNPGPILPYFPYRSPALRGSPAVVE